MGRIILVLLFAVFYNYNVFAASSGNCGTNCSYTLDDDGVLNIFPTDPNQPAGMNTFRSSPYLDNVSTVRSVNIASGFTSIPGDAFCCSATNLTSINIPDTVTSIGRYAFEGTGLQNVTIPTSVTNINRDAFHGQSSVQTITISAENADEINFGSNEGNWRQVNYGTVICRDCTPEQAQSLNAKLDAVSATRNGTQIRGNDAEGNTYIRDIYGAYIGGFDKSGNKLDFDENGHVSARYDVDGNLLKSYSYNGDGSVETYDANGRLVGLQNAKYITPAQAAALTKSKGNTVSITW